MNGKFTIFFEDPFWIGIIELFDENRLKVGKRIFGQEPSDPEVYEFAKEQYINIKLAEVETDCRMKKILNPKRMQRLVIKEQRKKGVGTKSQEALKKIQEEKKTERKHLSKDQKKAAQEYKFQLKMTKKKKKQKGH